MTGRYDFSNVKLSKMLRFFSVAEAHGLIYLRPSGENFSFAYAKRESVWLTGRTSPRCWSKKMTLISSLFFVQVISFITVYQFHIFSKIKSPACTMNMQSGFLVLHVLLELETESLCFSMFRKYVTSVTSSLVTQNTVSIAAEIKSKSTAAES